MLHLREVFHRLSTHGLVINVSKCQFGATTIDYQGHQITSQGAIPLPAKVEAIRTFARPTAIKGHQQFVGMLNFYYRFVPNAADTLAGKPMTLKWSDELDEAFTTAKEALAQATMVVHPHADKPTALTVDASGTAVGAVIEQNSDGSDWKPVAFFSRKLRPAEQNYSAFDRELLAAYLAIRHFRYFLEGRSFTLFTDHKPLTFAISKIGDPLSPRQQRHLAYVSEFTTDVRHIEGKANTVADTLSRGKSQRSAHLNLVWTIGRWQQLSVQTRVSQPSRQPPLHLSSGTYRWTITATRSCVTYPLADPDHALVPDTWQRTEFDAVHDLSHPSIRATKQLVAAKFVWPGLRKQVGIWAKTCLRCQAAKVHRHTTAPVDQFVPATHRFDHIHVDIVGPLPPSQNYRYLLTVVDRFTRWPEAIPLVDAQTTTCAKALALHVLDRSIWCTGRAHLRQWVTVHFGIVGDSVSAKRHASPQDNGVPSTVEWDCGTISSSFEICADGSPHRAEALIGSMNYHGFCSVSAPYPKRTSDVHRRRWCMERH